MLGGSRIPLQKQSLNDLEGSLEGQIGRPQLIPEDSLELPSEIHGLNRMNEAADQTMQMIGQRSRCLAELRNVLLV